MAARLKMFSKELDARVSRKELDGYLILPPDLLKA